MKIQNFSPEHFGIGDKVLAGYSAVAGALNDVRSHSNGRVLHRELNARFDRVIDLKGLTAEMLGMLEPHALARGTQERDFTPSFISLGIAGLSTRLAHRAREAADEELSRAGIQLKELINEFEGADVGIVPADGVDHLEVEKVVKDGWVEAAPKGLTSFTGTLDHAYNGMLTGIQVRHTKGLPGFRSHVLTSVRALGQPTGDQNVGAPMIRLAIAPK